MFIFKLRHDKRGMTLIEMIISLVILSILMTSTMGMITSSMSIFTATSMAALDRMVGNSVYQTLESALKYSTHLTISDTVDTSLTSQSFYVSVTDQDTKSGSIMYRAEGDDYLSLYNSDFYGNRTIQYIVDEVGSDGRHVEITVNIFREGEQVYTKSSIIKCVNLALIKTDVDNNSIDNNSADGSVNQYLYFAVDEMLISGGSDAWALEYKVNDFMRGYNAILAEYTGKLGVAEAPITEAVKNYGSKNSMPITTFNSLVATRDKAIFGDGTTSYAWEGNDSAEYNNLWAHYQEEMEEYLHFKPTKAGLETVNSPNPYHGVVATKEELFLGFMLEYYDKNGDGTIVKSEYPTFSDQNTFFNGTVMSNYLDDENIMAIMALFNDNVNENFRSLFTKSTDTINTYDDSVENTNTGATKGAEEWITTIDSLYKQGGYRYMGSELGSMSMTFASHDMNGNPLYYKYNGDGSNSVLGTYEVSTTQGDGFVTFHEVTASIVARLNDSSYSGADAVNLYDSNGVYGTASDWTITTTNCKQSYPTTATFDDVTCNLYTYKVYTSIPEAWMYFYKKVTASNGQEIDTYHVIYLEASHNANYEGPNGDQVVVTYGDGSTSTGAPEHVIQLYVDNSTNELYGYSYVRDGWSAIITDAIPRSVKTYSFNAHQYQDWTMYACEWNSWFNPSGTNGLLNGLITNITSWFTGDRRIDSISASNADEALGLVGTYSIDGISTETRSYNMAWVVYNPRRSTWYYVPDSSGRINTALSGVSWSSINNAPVPLDIEAWGSSTKMINDIERRKLSSSGLFGLVDTTQDYIWVPLPTGNKINANSAATLG